MRALTIVLTKQVVLTEKTSSNIKNKGNNKITELRTILQRESQNS